MTAVGSVQSGFLAVLRDAPHDRTARLAYADLLAEQGDAAGEARQRALSALETEDDCQRWLDVPANVGDSEVRLILAAILKEAGDERADGYRVLGLWGRVPFCCERVGRDWWFFSSSDMEDVIRQPDGGGDRSGLPNESWLVSYDLVAAKNDGNLYGTHCPGRRMAEDAAAIAFGRIRDTVRHRLLRGPS